MNILVLYDENQELTRRFREKGHNAFSCQEKNGIFVAIQHLL